MRVRGETGLSKACEGFSRRQCTGHLTSVSFRRHHRTFLLLMPCTRKVQGRWFAISVWHFLLPQWLKHQGPSMSHLTSVSYPLLHKGSAVLTCRSVLSHQQNRADHMDSQCQCCSMAARASCRVQRLVLVAMQQQQHTALAAG